MDEKLQAKLEELQADLVRHEAALAKAEEQVVTLTTYLHRIQGAINIVRSLMEE